jgi:hypothetical protein
MDTRFKRSTLVVSAVVAGVLVSSGVAFAYWTTSGTGTATAGVGTAGGVTVAQDGSIGGLFPGMVTPETIDFTVSNATTTPLFVDNVVVSIASITDQSVTPGPVCVAADFTLVQPTWLDVDIAAGGTASGTATISMNNTGANQDDCQGATVNLTFTAS